MASDQLRAIWQDGAEYGASDTFAADDDGSDAMQLWTSTITSAGVLFDENQLDSRTCSCCHTSAVVAESGTLLVANRDRTEAEISDISILRQVDGVCSDPAAVSADGWEISDCPVNGPAIDSNGG